MTLADWIESIDAKKQELDSLGPMTAENEARLWKKLRLEWNYNSNHIEGNTLTYAETKLLLLFDKTTGDHQMREYEEMQAHDVAIHMVREWAQDKERLISEADIRSLNKTILVKPFWKDAQTPDGQPTRREIKVGEYKEHPNSVRLKNGEIFEYASPAETPRLMGELWQWYIQHQHEHAVVLAAEMHYRFIRIHPFDDGNGRVARLLVNYILMRAGYPPIVIKSAEKEKYLTALQKADAGVREAFHEYVAEQVATALELALKVARGESVEEAGDVEKEIEVFKRKIKAQVKPTLEYTSRLMSNLFQEGPLFQVTAIRKKIETWVEMFEGYEFREEIQQANSINWDNGYITIPIDLTSPQSLFRSMLGSASPFRIHIHIHLKTYKYNGNRPFSISRSTYIEFEKYGYSVYASNNPIRHERSYSEHLTQTEVDDFLNATLLSVKKEIEEKSR